MRKVILGLLGAYFLFQGSMFFVYAATSTIEKEQWIRTQYEPDSGQQAKNLEFATKDKDTYSEGIQYIMQRFSSTRVETEAAMRDNRNGQLTKCMTSIRTGSGKCSSGFNSARSNLLIGTTVSDPKSNIITGGGSNIAVGKPLAAQQTTTTGSQNVTSNNSSQRAEDCAQSKSCIDTPEFTLEVSTFAPGGGFSGNMNFSQKLNWFLGTIIQKLVLIIGVIAVFIMTIGAGYMIINAGQDELVNKGKGMFMAGIYAVSLALGSYIIISLVRYLIYKI